MSDQALLAATSVKAIEKALAAGAKVDATDEDGQTKLLLVCKSRSGAMSKTEAAIALLLIDKGADVQRADNGGVTPLHRAAASGDHDVITRLLARGAKPVTTKLDYTPLHYCVSTHAKDTWIWDTLIAAGNPIDHVNKWGETPLLSAQSSWNPVAVKYLLAKGANRDVKDKDGKTLLERATALDQPKILKLL